MPLPKLKNFLSVKRALDSVLQICELVFQFWQLHTKKLSKTVSETCAKWLQFMMKFLKMVQSRPLDCLFLVFLNKPIQLLQQINVKNVHSVYGCRDSNPQPFENESSPITTRPGIPPYCCNCEQTAKHVIRKTLTGRF